MNLPRVEKSPIMDQKNRPKFERISAQLLARPDFFAVHGSVGSKWRNYRGRRLGPYFRLRYCQDGRERSLYLGRSEELAEEVRGLLADLQRRRIFRRLRERIRARSAAKNAA